MNFPTVTHEGFTLKHGGKYDAIRCYSPYILKLSNGTYILYYTGTAKCSHNHTHYRLLAATSKDGVEFEKIDSPIHDLHSGSIKSYSPTVIEEYDGTFSLYYGQNKGDGYRIWMTTSLDPLKFERPGEVVIDVDQKQFKSHVYNLRFIKKADVYHCYITGSNNPEKTKSGTNNELFSTDFRLFYGTSIDGKKFSDFQKINIDTSGFINMYGHDVVEVDGMTALIFSGFDGNESKLYISYSKNFIDFSKPELLFPIDSANGEISAYSVSLIQIAPKTFRLFYGSKISGAYQGIKTAVLKF